MTTKQSSASADDAQGIAGLPHSFGHRFQSLDDYLMHLECHAGPIDLPWWKEVQPGVYQRVTTATNAGPEMATRAELMKRFGFTR